MQDVKDNAAAEAVAADEKPAEETASSLGAPARVDYKSHIRALMAASKRKGNVKDFVIIAHHGVIYDHDRRFEVRAKLPETLTAGVHVYLFNRDGELEPMHVVRVEENGDPWVSNGNSAHKVTRGECYPTGIPRTPKLIHKSRLAPYIGERFAAMFWHKSLNRRVVHPGKDRVH